MFGNMPARCRRTARRDAGAPMAYITVCAANEDGGMREISLTTWS